MEYDLSLDTIFQRLCFLSGILRYSITVNKEATEPKVPSGKVNVISSPPRLGLTLQNVLPMSTDKFHLS